MLPVLRRMHIGSAELNRKLYREFLQHCDDADVRKTHLFHGRYENIYLTSRHAPALRPLLKQVREQAEQLLQRTDLDVGYWFNFMPPDAITSRHNHDDGFELLSAVYYVQVPPGSGELILHTAKVQRISPTAGLLLFFSSELDHEVSQNRSGQPRLSIAFNIGPQSAACTDKPVDSATF